MAKSKNDWNILTGEDITSNLRKRSNKFTYASYSKNLPKESRDKRKKKLEDDGYQYDKSLTSHIRFKKEKSIEDGTQLEDRVWSLLAKMGFDEMSGPRPFTIPISDNLSPEIDVFAKDSSTTLIVSCKDSMQFSLKSTVLKTELEKIKAEKQDIDSAINKRYPEPTPFKGYVIITRNHEWSKENLERAKNWGIAIVTENQLNYFEELANNLGIASRFQFLGELFENKTIKSMVGIQVPAIKGQYKKKNYYQFAIDAETLGRISFVNHKALSSDKGYQRLIKKPKLAGISSYINDGKVFPTNIIVNFNTNVRFDKTTLSQQGSIDNIEIGRLTLPDTMKSAFVVDGQHRLYGYFHEKTDAHFKSRNDLQVLAYENLDYDDERDLFFDINKNQKAIAPRLLIELESEMELNSTEATKKRSALCGSTILELNNSRESVLHQLISTEESSTDPNNGWISLTELRGALRKTSLIGNATKKGNIFDEGPLYDISSRDPKDTVKRAAQIISLFLEIFADGVSEHWNINGKRRNTPNSPGPHLRTALGIASLILLLENIINFQQQQSQSDFKKMTPKQIIQHIRPFCDPILEYFQNPTFDQIKSIRQTFGGSAPAKMMGELEIIVQKKFPDYTSPGLEKHIETRNEVRRKELDNRIRGLISTLKEITILFLKNRYSNGEDWFLYGVPQKTRSKMDNEFERHKITDPQNAQLENSMTLPMDAHDILTYSENREEAQGLFNGNDFNWLIRFNDLRPKATHEERSGIVTDEDNDFITNVVSPKIKYAAEALGIEYLDDVISEDEDY